MLKNIVEPDKTQMAILRMRLAWWITLTPGKYHELCRKLQSAAYRYCQYVSPFLDEKQIEIQPFMVEN